MYLYPIQFGLKRLFVATTGCSLACFALVIVLQQNGCIEQLPKEEKTVLHEMHLCDQVSCHLYAKMEIRWFAEDGKYHLVGLEIEGDRDYVGWSKLCPQLPKLRYVRIKGTNYLVDGQWIQPSR